MKRLFNLFYTMWAKVIIVFCLLFFMFQTSVCFADTTVLYRENDAALKNVFTQWDNYDYETSEYLKSEIEDAIDYVLQYCLYYHRGSDENNQTIMNADDNYRFIATQIRSYHDFSYAVVNHDTGIVLSNIEEINYKSTGINVRQHFPEHNSALLIIRNAHNPYYENGTLSQYTKYVTDLSNSYADNFDLYMFFGEDFSFIRGSENFEQTHYRFLGRIKTVAALSIIYLTIAAILFIVLMLVTGKTEIGGKIYPGLTDLLPNDTKFCLYMVVFLSMAALHENSLYMALRVDNFDSWLGGSFDFYIARSYIAMLVNTCIITATGCTLKRQYRLGTLLTNTYIYKFFFAHRDKKGN